MRPKLWLILILLLVGCQSVITDRLPVVYRDSATLTITPTPTVTPTPTPEIYPPAPGDTQSRTAIPQPPEATRIIHEDPQATRPPEKTGAGID